MQALNSSRLVANYERDLLEYGLKPIGWDLEPIYKFVIFACARWEEGSIVEWLNYHRALGVSHVYLYGNDDRPDTLFEQIMPFVLGTNPFVTFIHYPFQGQQLQIYIHAVRNFSQTSEWVMFLDLDEYLCIKNTNRIDALVEQIADDTDCVYFNWCNFGTNGFKVRPFGSVLKNYIMREEIAVPFSKNMIRSKRIPYDKLIKKPYVAIMHDWAEVDPDLRIRNVLGHDMGNYYKDWPTNAWAYLNQPDVNQSILAVGYVAHYSMKSDEDFDRRARRGSKGDYGSEVVWSEMDPKEQAAFNARTNAVKDAYLRDFWTDYLAQSERFDAFPKRRWRLISEGASATQSSIIKAHTYRTLEEDATSVLNEAPKGRATNHTEMEIDPWWQVDLGSLHTVYEIRVFNRLDHGVERMRRLRIGISDHGSEWIQLYLKLDNRLYGGADGTPLVISPTPAVKARYVRIVVLEKTYLHFDRVEIYGRRSVAGAEEPRS